MTNIAELMHETRPPTANRSRNTLGGGFTKDVEFFGEIDMTFLSTADIPVTLYDLSFVPGLGSGILSFSLQAKHAYVV